MTIISGSKMKKETIDSLEALGEVLLRIRVRMLSEGFDVVDGKVVSLESTGVNAKENTRPPDTP